MERSCTLASRAWSCFALAAGVKYAVQQRVKQEPAQDFEQRLQDMSSEEIQQQISESRQPIIITRV